MPDDDLTPDVTPDATPTRRPLVSRRQVLIGGLAAAAGGAVIAASRANLFDSASGAKAASPARIPATARRTPSTTAAGAGGKRGPGTLVLVTLYGGNDGLDTVIPIGDPAFAGLRGAFAPAADKVLPLSDGLALHPSMSKLKAQWDAGRLAIVPGAGYPEPDHSHFRSMSIWQSAVPERAETTGWIGRWLDATGTDPLRAIAIGANLPPALAGAKTSGSALPVGGVALASGTPLVDAYRALVGHWPSTPPLAARTATVGRDLFTVAHEAGRALQAGAADPGLLSGDAGTAGGYGSGDLAAPLDAVARLMHADLPTRVYAVSANGFDNHASERGVHDRLLGQLDAALGGFVAAIDGAPRAEETVIAVYSEFGRRVVPNASAGTDHGTAGPILLVGPGVKGGIVGAPPSLTDLDNGDLRMTTDFRAVYSTLLADVLGTDPSIAIEGRYPALSFTV